MKSIKNNNEPILPTSLENLEGYIIDQVKLEQHIFTSSKITILLKKDNKTIELTIQAMGGGIGEGLNVDRIDTTYPSNTTPPLT